MKIKHLVVIIPAIFCCSNALAEEHLGSTLESNSGSDSVLLAQLETCRVDYLQRGQLAVRNSPGGEARAGLDNGDIVEIYRQQGDWACIRVIRPVGDRLAGIEGWVNNNYINCGSGFSYVLWGMIQEDSRAIANQVPRGICSR